MSDNLTNADNKSVTELDSSIKSSTDATVLLAEVNAFRIRIGRRNTRDVDGVKVLIGAVESIAHQDCEKGRALFRQATEKYQQSIGTENQMWFLFGALLSSAAIFFIAWLLIIGAREHLPILDNLVGPAQLATLTFFAVVGTLTSIMLRLSSINMRDEERRSYVMFSAAIHPLMAAGFMSIVYVILKYKVIVVTLGVDSNPEAFTWIAAFLCGFSEKFAPTLLENLSGSFLPKDSKLQGDTNAN